MKHKMKRTLFIFGLLDFLTASSFSQEKDFPELKGPYLGQKPPGKTPSHLPSISSTPMTYFFMVTLSFRTAGKRLIGNWT
jgi:hypothetical protein